MSRTSAPPRSLADRPSPDALRELWTRTDALIDGLEPRLVRFRRQIHATPEPANEEFATTALVAETLREQGLEPRIMQGDVGVMADIDLEAAGNSFIALRSELDCVEVNDDKQVAYASTRPGLCHACAHDAHCTIVTAAAVAIANLREKMEGIPFRHNIRLIFQPAEETGDGARTMIQQGAIDGVEAILALHADTSMVPGLVGLRKGPLTSACKSFLIRVRGRSGHSARPYEAVDPIPAATNIVSMLYQVCPRSIDARSPLALTVSSISAGSSFNAIPGEAIVRGTLRTTRNEDTDIVQRRMEAIVHSVGEATGCDTELGFPHHSPPTDNEGALVDLIAATATDLLGPGSVRWLEHASLGAEDFGFFQELIPGVIFRLGAGPAEERQRRPLHSSLFDIDEAALPVGAKLLTRAALELAATAGGRME